MCKIRESAMFLSEMTEIHKKAKSNNLLKNNINSGSKVKSWSWRRWQNIFRKIDRKDKRTKYESQRWTKESNFRIWWVI